MKTQLLEDIGESAALFPPTSRPAGNPNLEQGVPVRAPASSAPSARPRAATGVWRQRVVPEPLSPATRPAEDAAPLELDKIFGELAALEAQFVHPETQQPLPASHAEPLDQPGSALEEAATVPNPTLTATAPRDPWFDFTPPAPAPHMAVPFTPAPAGLLRSKKRFLAWGAAAFSAALLAWGGRYLVQERHDDGSLALVASQAIIKPRADVPSDGRGLAATAPGAEPGTGAPVPPALAASAPSPEMAPPGVPPLVMLEPDPPAAVKPEPAARPATGRGDALTAPKLVRAAKPAPASPQKKPPIRKTRERADAIATAAKEKRQREPVRQLARAPVVQAEKPFAPDTSMAATLKACREHGYHAAQCIKRQCSVGVYGFACRGR